MKTEPQRICHRNPMRKLLPKSRNARSRTSLQLASLYAMAAEVSRRQLPREEAVQTTGVAGIETNETNETNDESRFQSDAIDYQELAVKVLSACAEKGMIQSPRSQRWVQSCRELAILRERNDFQHVVGEVEKASKTEKVCDSHGTSPRSMKPSMLNSPWNDSQPNILTWPTWGRCSTCPRVYGQPVTNLHSARARQTRRPSTFHAAHPAWSVVFEKAISIFQRTNRP